VIEITLGIKIMLAKETLKTVKTAADPVDIYVGKKIRQRRTVLGVSQEKLSEALGITFQQVQKYESGANRVSSSRLYHISKILGTTISYFFDGHDGEHANNIQQVAETKNALEDQDIFLQKETINLVKVYYTIDDEDVRKKVLEMVKSIAQTHGLTKKK
jgi:transcriptional regulator with XRE-family HTH domain